MNLLTLAEQYGTPLYVYDAHSIRHQYRELASSIPRATILYAMKANSHPAILEILRQEGAHIDAVSPAEVLLAKRVGFTPEQILFTGTMTGADEMIRVHDESVLLNIGSLSELERYADQYPESDICLRFNPDIVTGHHDHVKTAGRHSKFGIALKDAKTAARVAKEYALHVIGLHEHAGSGIENAEDMQAGIEALLSVAHHFPELRFVDFGGGFPIPYKPGQSKIEWKGLADFIDRKVPKTLAVYLEPGRYLVAEAGVLLVQATTLKQNSGTTFVGVDSGFSHLIRPVLYGAYHHIVNLSHPEGTPQVYDVVGNICETGDFFARGRSIPEVWEGDILAICDVGAYGYSMGSTYNLRPLPAEVLVDGDKVRVITPRKTAGQLVDEMMKL